MMMTILIHARWALILPIKENILPKKWKQRWFGHVSKSSVLAMTILQGTVKGKKIEEVDRGRGGRTISKSGQEWTCPAQLGQLKTGQDRKGLL